MDKVLPISIIIPTKNEEKRIGLLLKSIKKQLFQPEEIIVADAFSTDKTRKIALSHGAKVIDGGIPSVGRNNGAATASQKILLFLDADSLLPSETTLIELYLQFEKDKLDLANAVLQINNSEFKSHSVPVIVPKLFFSWWNFSMDASQHIQRGVTGCGICMMVRASVFKKLKGFKSDIDFIGEDHEFTKRLIDRHYKYELIHTPIIASARRYDTPQKVTRAFTTLAIMSVLIGFGVANSNSLLKKLRDLYGNLGGTEK